MSVSNILVRLSPNGINLGLFKIRFSTFWLTEPKCTETDLKKSQSCTICRQSDQVGTNPDILDSQYLLEHGYQIWPQSGSDWPQMRQIREFFRSDSVHFGSPSQKVLKII